MSDPIVLRKALRATKDLIDIQQAEIDLLTEIGSTVADIDFAKDVLQRLKRKRDLLKALFP